MARRNPKIVALEEELRKANLKAENEKELRLRKEGQLEKYEEQEEREQDEIRSMRNREDQYRQNLEDQVGWLRRLVEDLAMPKEKLEVLRKAREELIISGNPGGYPMEPSRRNRY